MYNRAHCGIGPYEWTALGKENTKEEKKREKILPHLICYDEKMEEMKKERRRGEWSGGEREKERQRTEELK